MGRNPFQLNTERAKNSIGADGYQDSGRQNTNSSGQKFSGTAAKKASIGDKSSKGHSRNPSNPFTGPSPGIPSTIREQRPDSMISGGRGGSPDDSMMYQNKFVHNPPQV